MNDLLQVENICFSVPTGHVIQGRKVILDHINFSIPRGSATAYIGPNGAGKTSTFRVLCGLIRTTSGQVLFNGKECSHGLPPKQLGFMPEQPYFYKNLTPKEMLTGFGRLAGMTAFDVAKAIKHWAESLDFCSVLNQRMSTCSKGQVQRAGLAQSLMHRPDFLLLDEPLSGLDPISRECVRSVLDDAVKQGTTLLFSSHILTDAETLCNQVIILNKGSTVYTGSIAKLIETDSEWTIRCYSNKILWKDITTIQASRAIDQSWNIICPNIAVRNILIHKILASSATELISVIPRRKTLEEAFIDLLAHQKRAKSR